MSLMLRECKIKDEKTKNELHYLDNHDQLTNMKSILLYCNKMDLPDSLLSSYRIDALKIRLKSFPT